MSVHARRSLTVVLAAAIALAGCASSDRKSAQVPGEAPLIVDVKAPAAMLEKDAQGSYRFDMQQGQTRMTADQFDAWMKANGIRVARGAAPAPGAKGAAAGKGAARE